jgi:hypothetical protein
MGVAAPRKAGGKGVPLSGRRQISFLSKRKRERYREGLIPCQPAFIVAKIDPAAGLLRQVTDEAIIEENAKRCVLTLAGH